MRFAHYSLRNSTSDDPRSAPGSATSPPSSLSPLAPNNRIPCAHPRPRPRSPPVHNRPVLPGRTRKTGNPRLATPRSPAARPEGAGKNNVHKGRDHPGVRTGLLGRQRELRRHCTDPGERPVD